MGAPGHLGGAVQPVGDMPLILLGDGVDQLVVALLQPDQGGEAGAVGLAGPHHLLRVEAAEMPGQGGGKPNVESATIRSPGRVLLRWQGCLAWQPHSRNSRAPVRRLSGPTHLYFIGGSGYIRVSGMDFASRTDPAAIQDLRSRLRATRWPHLSGDAEWAFGTDPDYLRELVAYWADEFDWEAREAELNRLPRFRVDVGGLSIHVIHSVVDRDRPAPTLLLAHGWPDSFWRYLKVIPLLAQDFDLVVPDMPGFGYSDTPAGAPLNSREVAGLWAELMTELGYEKFFAAGGDIGSDVSRYLALDYPGRVTAVHRMSAGLPTPGTDATGLTPAEREWMGGALAWIGAEGAYAAMHRTGGPAAD
jgi:Epoxide hydrolase N terminus